MAKKEPNIPIAGMVDVHPMNIKDNQYPLMLNGNIQTDISSGITLTNEHSNLLCNNLPAGYSLIGSLFVPGDNITYVWLVNRDNNKSQIGYLSEYILDEDQDEYIDNTCNECVKKKQEAIPLEKRDQSELCQYTCISAADCLAFNIDFPVRKAVIKKDNCGDTLYFTDFLNPVRALKLTLDHKIDDTQRTVITPATCDDPAVYASYCSYNDLDCIQILLFPQANHIGVTPELISSGGTLRAGTYQLAVAYATKDGHRATRTFSVSNPVSIFDPHQTVTSQLDYTTDLSIKFLIENLDNKEYRFIDVFVIATINRVGSVKQYGPIDISAVKDGTLEYRVSDFEKGMDVSIDDVFQNFPIYEKAQEITSAGDTLLLGNLTGPRDLNLQRAVNNLSPTVRWSTAEAPEDIYADGIADANSRGYLRDEVYPLGIVFERNNTQYTCAFPLIGRDIDVVFWPETQGPDVLPDGTNILFRGIWNQYLAANGGYDTGSIVTYNGDYYVSTADNNGNIPGGPDWSSITAGDPIYFYSTGSFSDISTVNGADAFQYPGCASDPDYNLRWKVYNTANNLGQLPCTTAINSGLSCVLKTVHIGCSSYTFKSSTLLLESQTGDFVVGDVLTGSGGVGTILSISQQHGLIPYVTLDTTTITGGSSAFANGDNITGSISGATATVSIFNLGDTPPNDCYISSTDTGDCATNYPTPYDDPSLAPSDPLCSDPNPDPQPKKDPDCNTPNVRPQSLAASSGILCVDGQLLEYPNNLSEPYAYRTSFKQKEVIPLQTNDYYVYNLSRLITAVPTPPSPTPTLSGGPFEGSIPRLATNNGTWIWPGGNFSPTPINNLSTQSLQVPPITENQGCSEYNSTTLATINVVGDGPRYFLGDSIDPPVGSTGCSFCSTGCSGDFSDCDPIAPASDYWGIGAQTFIGTTDRNTTGYQSRWYKINATTPSMIIKMKLGFSDSTTFADGDLRIDVYAGNPFGIPVYSTGTDSVSPADYCYTAGGTVDTGVLVIGDVAGSVTTTTHNGATLPQEPLIQGLDYYIHIYLLPAGTAKLNGPAYYNCYHDGASTTSPASKATTCYLVRYAWANFCIEYPTASTTKTVTTPAISSMSCEYDIIYRIKEVPNVACNLSPFEYGNFAFWQSETKTYPQNPEVWGEMCGKQIRHFKFPDCLVSYLQDEDQINLGVAGGDSGYTANNARKARVYPMGWKIDPEDVKAWLVWAVSEGLITESERLSITGYKLVRGNRVGNKSIQAKGLLYDMFRYKQRDWVNGTFSNIPYYFANYPFNDLRPDPYLSESGLGAIQAPENGAGNSKYAFLSPDTTFNSPTLGTELKLEAANFGDSLGQFYEVLNHPKWVLLGNGGIILVGVLAGIQLSADLLVLLGQLYGTQIVGLADSIPTGFIIGLVGGILNLVPNLFKYMHDWNTLITNFGVPFNFARYYAAVGNYHSSGITGQILNDASNKRRPIGTYSYLLSGNISLSSSGVLERINNYEREDSVYIDLGDLSQGFVYASTAIDRAVKGDFSKFTLTASTSNNGPGCSMTDRGGTVASLYASIKSSVPDQYGSIQDIQWLFTGKYVAIDWDSQQAEQCDPIYGGDTFISRMTQKRKLPFFLDNPVGVDTSVDFQYQHLSNITDANFFVNSVGESSLNSSAIQFKTVEHNLQYCGAGSGDGKIYIKGYMYLFSYGIVSFIGESDFNLNFRYAEDTKFRDFYPHNSDVENWTQEYRIPIETPNAYLYNRDYSKQNTENVFCTQPVIYHNDDCNFMYKNRIINSITDTDSDFYMDNWRIFLAEDKKDFDLVNGQLTGLDGIEREKVLVRFGNTYNIFNAFYTIDTGQGTAQIGTGSMFAQKPEEYAKTELGYGGTEHHAFASTQFGHFWVDARRSSVFMLPPGSGAAEEISSSYNNFFNNNLPFYILKDFPQYNVDNNYKDIGITLVWDNRFDRLILTKLDYALRSFYRNKITYDGSNFLLDGTIVQLTDEEYFCNKSWTIGYSPLTKSWIGFYSFVPNYYISYENYFQSGVNSVRPGADRIGIWNHLITNKSYQVYYGTLYPFITDVVVKDQLVNKQLQSIEYQADFLRFQDDFDYFYNPGVTFNKMVIWSENQNSGVLNLVPQVPNDLSQAVRYPMYNSGSTTIMVTRKENSWRANQFSDIVADKYSNVPPMILGCHPYLKEVNMNAVNYNKPTFQRSRFTSDYFTLRLINDQYSNYKIIDKWFLSNNIISTT